MVMQLLLISICAILIFMTIAFIIAEIKKDNSVVDIFWGLGFILISWITLIKANLFLPRQLLITSLITVWGLRLSFYILWRKKGKGEDPRYTNMRKSSGAYAAVYSFFSVFMLQGGLMILIATPLILINTSTQPTLNALDYMGSILWLFGIIYETVADIQLYTFLKTKGSAIMNSGLWHYSRHPNYFGEWLVWWGIFLIALSASYGWLAIISLAAITYILFFISTPITEQQFAGNPQYEKYKKNTPAIIPLKY